MMTSQPGVVVKGCQRSSEWLSQGGGSGSGEASLDELTSLLDKPLLKRGWDVPVMHQPETISLVHHGELNR